MPRTRRPVGSFVRIKPEPNYQKLINLAENKPGVILKHSLHKWYLVRFPNGYKATLPESILVSAHPNSIKDNESLASVLNPEPAKEVWSWDTCTV